MVSHATTFSVSGEVWENGTTSNVPAQGSAIYGTTPTATFTLNPTVDQLNFFSSTGGGPDYPSQGLSGFLTTNDNDVSSGATVTYQTGSSAANHSIIDDVFQFTGTTTLTTGNYAFIYNDGGLIFYLGSNAVIDDPSPSFYGYSVLCVGPGTGCVAAGTYSFTLDYAAVGVPADVQLLTTFPLPLAPDVTPEPASIVLLGTGLLAAAWSLRRRTIA
jgi:hypothetical protein